jgi:PEP-CTERM motif
VVSVLIRGLGAGFALLAGLLVAAQPVQAQALLATQLPITFTGVVSSSTRDTIRIVQPDGTTTPYTGPVPAYPYEKGQPVSITFNATVPTKAFFSSPYYSGQVAADGIYRFALSTTSLNPAKPLGIGNITLPLGGVGDPTLNNGNQDPVARMTIVYDSNTDTYSLEGSGGFTASAYAGPGFRYDGTTGQLISCATADICKNGQPGSFHLGGGADYFFGLTGDATGTQVATGTIPILDDITNGFAGYFNVTMTGSWNLPQFGGATAVPEPGMLGLFGSGVVLLAARRRRRRA